MPSDSLHADPADPSAAEHPQILLRFREFAERYDTLLCDIWGVVHNGVRSWPDACDALHRFRQAGGRVCLITNAPRPAAFVQRLLDRLKVPHHSYDAIVTSGDLTRAMVAQRAGSNLFHLGPERDLPVFEGIDVTLSDQASADAVVNTGLFDDDTETPDDYADMLRSFRDRGLTMICGNPDKVVERGDRLIYCAGALADAYEAIGGEVLWAGKPHPPIYAEAVRLVEEASGRPVDRDRVLAIGDSLRTDLAGAERFGIDSVFIASGIHGAELIGETGLDAAALEASFEAAGVHPKAIMTRLVW